MFLAPKVSGSFRAIVHYRLLKKRTDESVPLPDIHSAFGWFAKAQYFTTLDLNHACHQIPIYEASENVMAFRTNWNLYQYRRVPFGLARAAQVLTRPLDQFFIISNLNLLLP
jgi:hypothetical protein